MELAAVRVGRERRGKVRRMAWAVVVSGRGVIIACRLGGNCGS